MINGKHLLNMISTKAYQMSTVHHVTTDVWNFHQQTWCMIDTDKTLIEGRFWTRQGISWMFQKTKSVLTSCAARLCTIAILFQVQKLQFNKSDKCGDHGNGPPHPIPLMRKRPVQMHTNGCREVLYHVGTTCRISHFMEYHHLTRLELIPKRSES